MTEYPHLLQLEEILGSSGILRADLGFAVLSLFFVISYRYNIKMGVEAEILAKPKFHYFCIDFGFEKGNLTVSIFSDHDRDDSFNTFDPVISFSDLPDSATMSFLSRPSDDASPDPEKYL